MARRPRRGSSRSENTDLSKVEGRRPVAKEGDHLMKVAETSLEKGDAGRYISWKFEIVDGPSEGGVVYHNTSLAPQALFNLRGVLEALGIEITEGLMSDDVADDAEKGEYDDMEMMGTIEHEVWEGRKRARLVDFFPAEEDEPEPETRSSRRKDKKKEEEEPEPRARSRRSGGKKKSKEIVLSQEEINDMTQDELEGVIEDADLDCDLSEYRTLGKMKAAVIDAAEKAGILEDGEEPEGEEAEEPAPRSSRRSSRNKDKDTSARSSRRRR